MNYRLKRTLIKRPPSTQTFHTIHSTRVRDKSPSDLQNINARAELAKKVHQLFPMISGHFVGLVNGVIDQINHTKVSYEGSLAGKFYHCANKVNTR